MVKEQKQPEEKELVFPDDYFQYDPQDMRTQMKGLPKQIKEAYKIGANVNVEGEVNRVIVTGMGGSAIAGLVLKSFLEPDNLNIEVCSEYNLPIHVDSKTLIIANSYSGNTEETISTYREAIRKGCKIIAICTGGKLADLSEMNRNPLVKIPKNLTQPRIAIAYSFFPILKVLENLRIIENKEKEVQRLIKALDKEIYQTTGINLSEKLEGKVPIIYSSKIFEPVAYRWKCQLNENAKTMAFNNVFPEMNHNEMQGSKNLPAEFHCVMIKSDVDHRRVVKRMDVTKKVLRGKGIEVTEIGIKGDTLLTKLFSAIYIGDWTSYFLALRYKTDPENNSMIDEFKKDMGPYVA
jgi:glucose/mannose-6-phosphate isomerase